MPQSHAEHVTEPSAACVIVVSGVMAAGKSTVGDLLAHRFSRAVHVRGDVFRRFIVTGRAEPTPEMLPEARAQLLLRYRLATSVADAYATAGFVVVLQDIIMGPALGDVVGRISSPAYVVVLDPSPAAVEAREAARDKSGYLDGWTARDFVSELRATTPRLGLWIDSSDQTPEQTVQAIIDGLDDASLGQSR